MTSLLRYQGDLIKEVQLSMKKKDARRQWKQAFVSIYCSRALLSLQQPQFSKNKIHHPSIAKTLPSFTALSIDDNPCENNNFSIAPKDLTLLIKEKKLDTVKQIGGVESVASALETDITTGISGTPEEVTRRQRAFGSNAYNKPPTKTLFHFVAEAFKDLTILILMACAALSLGFGIKQHGISDGWYDGGSIFVAVFLVITVSAVSNFKQNRQFDKLSRESGNIQMEVVRDRRRQIISIYEIVVGDIVCLKIGDQVPADGLFVDGHSLRVDESSMTGESDHVEVNRDSHPFLVSGTKVVDGYATMLVTSVGMNTTWGEMMSSLTRDTNEQTPLQVINIVSISMFRVVLRWGELETKYRLRCRLINRALNVSLYF